MANRRRTLCVRDPSWAVCASFNRRVIPGGTAKVHIAPERCASVVEMFIDAFTVLRQSTTGQGQLRRFIRQKSNAIDGGCCSTLAARRRLDCHAMEQAPRAAHVRRSLD